MQCVMCNMYCVLCNMYCVTCNMYWVLCTTCYLLQGVLLGQMKRLSLKARRVLNTASLSLLVLQKKPKPSREAGASASESETIKQLPVKTIKKSALSCATPACTPDASKKKKVSILKAYEDQWGAGGGAAGEDEVGQVGGEGCTETGEEGGGEHEARGEGESGVSDLKTWRRSVLRMGQGRNNFRIEFP